MIIFAIIAIGLVVIVAGGFVGRSRKQRNREENARNATHTGSHRGPGSHRSRGRGRGHCPDGQAGDQVGRRVRSSWTLSKRICFFSTASNSFSSRT